VLTGKGQLDESLRSLNLGYLRKNNERSSKYGIAKVDTGPKV
jgi:hypothetical protein